jgi:hypothetical protein
LIIKNAEPYLILKKVNQGESVYENIKLNLQNTTNVDINTNTKICKRMTGGKDCTLDRSSIFDLQNGIKKGEIKFYDYN